MRSAPARTAARPVAMPSGSHQPDLASLGTGHFGAYDPQDSTSTRPIATELDYAADLTAAVTGAHLVCMLTEWGDFRHADPYPIAEQVAARPILDAGNSLDPARWERAGRRYRGVGRHHPYDGHPCGRP